MPYVVAIHVVCRLPVVISCVAFYIPLVQNFSDTFLQLAKFSFTYDPHLVLLCIFFNTNIF